jgi:hypothetical protein
VIASGVCGLTTGLARRVEQLVLPDAPGQTCARLRHAVRAAIRDADPDADPDAYADRRKQAEESRRLELWPTDEGTSDLTGRNLPADQADAAYNRINAIAQAMKTDGDPRTIDQLRADVLIALIRNQRPSDPPPADSVGRPSSADDDGGTERATASAIADVLRDQFTALTDNLDRDGRTHGGQTALVREAARRVKTALAELSSRWCVNAADTNGNIIRHGAPAYRVPASVS